MTSQSLVERGARAVHEVYLATAKRLGWPVKPALDVDYELLSEGAKELDRATFRTAIAAMREPTEAMRVAGVEALGRHKMETAGFLRVAGKEEAFAAYLLADSRMTDPVWRAMIDSALESK